MLKLRDIGQNLHFTGSPHKTHERRSDSPNILMKNTIDPFSNLFDLAPAAMALLNNNKAPVLRMGSLSFLLLLLMFALYKFLTYSRTETIPQGPTLDYEAAFETEASNDTIRPDGWKFQATRDARDFALSDEQCSAAFPKLYTDINRMVKRY